MIEPIDEVWQSIDNTKIATVASNQDADANLHLIANAPDWLNYLIGEVERLQKEINNYWNAMVEVVGEDMAYTIIDKIPGEGSEEE